MMGMIISKYISFCISSYCWSRNSTHIKL